ncbi:MAG TPA: UvrD-helicase domain-containing protein [Steroidobacteraceae bacterium]|nr:UvrD-helicase domain-containing protein [Steroidobacteraceae bacterium]
MIDSAATLEDRDAAARERALDPSRSILLEAPAGSGKTTVLTLRFLRLLCAVDEPEQILAITFTRKAAGEMRERVLRALRGEGEALSSARGRELAAAVLARSRARAWLLESDPGRLRIQTIDALNLRIASQQPLSARGAGDARIMEAPAMLYRRAARRALLDAESDAHLRVDAQRLFERLDNDFGRFERLLTDMLGARGHWLPVLLGTSASGALSPAPLESRGVELPARVEESLRSVIGERLRGASGSIPAQLIVEGSFLAWQAALKRADHEASGASERQPWRAWLEPPAAGASLSLRHWQGLAQLALTQQGEWRRTLSIREGFPSDDAAAKALKTRALDWIADLTRIEARERLCEIASLPDVELPAEDAAALSSLARVLQLAASELALVFAESRQADFVQLAAAARQALAEEGAPSDLALELGTDIRHILVDEFQDTSIEQVRLLEALTASWEEGDGRTLFAVGDPMQSIYQFREAEVGLFLRAGTHGVGKVSLERLALTRNFRSRPALVAWLNRVFPPCFPARDDPRTSAVRYRPCVAALADDSVASAEGAVHLHPTRPADREAEAHAVVDLIRAARTRKPDASIAVLVAARAHATPISAALEAAGIPVNGVDLLPLGELSVVRDLEMLARALDHLADRTAWLAVLRAPWCGLTLVELTALLEGPRERTVWEAIHDEERVALLQSAARARLERTQSVLARALERRDRLDLASCVESTWLALGGPAACREDADLDRAQAFLARLAEWSSEPAWTGPLELAERLETLYASPDGRTPGAVQIMTIHAAKGLEFDTVIVPALGRKLRASPEPLLRWLELPREEAGTDLLMAAIPPPWRREEDRFGAYLKRLAAQRAANERIRLLYVAATRARSQLHLFAEAPQRGVGGAVAPAVLAASAAPAEGTLLAALWPGIVNPFLEAAARLAQPAATGPAEVLAGAIVASTEASAPAPAPAVLIRLAADWKLPFLPDGPRPDGLSGSLAEASPEIEPERGSGLLRGSDAGATQLARVAARIVADQLRRSGRAGRLPASGSAALDRALRERLRRLGLEGDPLEEAAQRANAIWDRCLADPKLQWIFSTSHTRIESACRLSGLHAGRLASVMLDRTFVDESGVRWLIRIVANDVAEERSVDRPAGGADRAGEWADRAVPLARALGPERVRAALYDPAGQIWRELG